MSDTQSFAGMTLLEAIKQDHREIEAFYNEYERSAGEEVIVYPLLEKELGQKGLAMAEHDREDHQYVKDRLKKIERMEVGTPDFDALLKDVMVHLREHIKDEEEVDFPQLESALGADRSLETAKSFERTKNFVPTRPHPSAPSKTPFETLAGMLAAPLDKLKDAFSKFPTEEQRESATADYIAKN